MEETKQPALLESSVERIATAVERLAASADKQPSRFMQALTVAATLAGGMSLVIVADVIIKWIIGG
jgi:hypothetical protein